MDQTIQSHIVTTIDFFRNFPSPPIPRLPRQQLYEVTAKALEAHRIVMLVGEPLSGKTEFLADFMRRSPNTSIGIFLNSDLGVFNCPNYLRLVVAEQVSWILDGTRISDDFVTDERYLQLLYKLQRYAKNNRITWLIDGLTPDRSGGSRDLSELFQLIPLGMREFNFVITGESDLTSSLGVKAQKPKEVPIFPVGLEEATSYFADLGIKESEIQEIRHFCSGVVGRMQKFREFLCNGVSFESLLSQRNPSLEMLFEFEWNLTPQTEEMNRLLAYVVFSNKPVTLEELSRFIGCDVTNVKALIDKCRILSFLEDKNTVVIESRAQRSFIKSRVAELERNVRSHVITSLLEAPKSKDATIYLPSQLMDAGRHDDLLGHLGPNHFINLLDTERSLYSIRRHAEFGISAARARNNSTAELSFSLIRSTATGLTFSVGSEYQIEALVRLGSPGSAIELASMALTKEERLHLLAVAANALHANSQAIPTELKEQIELLEEDVSFEAIGELGIEIACNLLPLDFDRAMEITRRVLESAQKRLESNGETVISSELSAPIGERGKISTPSGRRNLDLIPEHQARKVSEAIASTVERFSPERIVTFIKRIEPANKIAVLAGWLGQNKEHPDAHKIAEQALDLVLGEVSRAPRLKDLREIAEVLPHIKDDDHRSSLARRIETQLGLLGHQGTSEEFVRLRILLHRVRFTADASQTELSLIELFAEIEAINEIGVRTTCWTWMLHGLTLFENADKIEADTGLISEVLNNLSSSIDILLASTANHHLAAKAAISALAQTNPDDAFKLVTRLNTEASRDKGYEELARSLVLSNVKAETIPILKKTIHSIRNDEIMNRVIIKSLRTLVRTGEKKQIPFVTSEFGELWKLIRVSAGRLQALAVTYRLKLQGDKASVDIGEMEHVLESTWEQILVDSVKVEVGYLVAVELAVDEPVVARSWVRRSVEYAKERQIPSDTVLDSLVTTVLLGIRIYPYLDDSNDDSFRRLASLVKFIPSCEHQLNLWTQLGIKLFYAGKIEKAKQVVGEFIDPILNSSYAGNELVLDSMVAYAAPLLYQIHPASATQTISRVTSGLYRALARSNICDVLLRRCHVSEPFEVPEEHAYRLDSAIAADILAVVKDVTTDAFIYSIVHDLCLSLGAEINKQKITRNSVVNHLNSLRSIVEKNLPDKKIYSTRVS